MAKKKSLANSGRPVCFHPDTKQINLSKEEEQAAIVIAWKAYNEAPMNGIPKDEETIFTIARLAIVFHQRLIAVQQCASGNL